MMFLVWNKIKGWVIAAGAALAVALTIYLKGRSDQKSHNENKELKDRLTSVKKSKEISDEVRKMSPSAVDRELDRFMRD